MKFSFENKFALNLPKQICHTHQQDIQKQKYDCFSVYFFFCHYFWFLAYRWTHNTQVCVKTQVLFFFFFLQYILIKNGLLVFRSGDHEFESRWCYSHRWLGRNEAKLGVLSGWEGCYSLCWSIVHICELIHCMCWRVDRSFLRVCYTTMWRSRSRSKRCCGWLHISWRKCVLAFTFPGW